MTLEGQYKMGALEVKGHVVGASCGVSQGWMISPVFADGGTWGVVV